MQDLLTWAGKKEGLMGLTDNWQMAKILTDNWQIAENLIEYHCLGFFCQLKKDLIVLE